MRAIADVASGVVKAEIEIEATPDRVFHSLTDPRELGAWWGSAEYRTHSWQVDLRVGGKWSTIARAADGTEMTVDGEYLEVDPPRRLVFTWRPSWEGYAVTTVRCDLEPTAAGTRVRITHTGFGDNIDSAMGTGEGWKRVLEWLAAHLGDRRG